MTEQPPSHDELLAAYRTVERLQNIVGYEVKDADGRQLWGQLVDAKRMIATATFYLASDVDAKYEDTWQQMLRDD